MPMTGRDADQCKIRLPEGMRDEIKATAESNGRSLNSEIVSRLMRSPTYEIILRDTFAGQALAGMLANSDDVGDFLHVNGPKAAAQYAYRFADEMLKARKL